MKRFIILVTLGTILLAMAGFFGCAESDNPVGDDGSGDTLGTGTNPPTPEFGLAADILDDMAATSGQSQLFVGMALVGDLMDNPTPGGPRYIPSGDGGEPTVLVESLFVDGDWFVFDFSATLADGDDTIQVAGIDSIRFEASGGGYTTQPDSTVTGFEIRSHIDGTVSGTEGSATTASHGSLDFSGSIDGVLTINASSNDTVTMVDDFVGCTYTVASNADWINLVFDLSSIEQDDGPASGSLSMSASITSTCGPGAPDSVQVDGQWSFSMTFDNGTNTITVGDGNQTWTFTDDEAGYDDSTSDSAWWPDDTGWDTTGDSTWPADSGDSGYYNYCDTPHTSQATLDSMKLWAFGDGPGHDDGSIGEVTQITLEALQTIDTMLTNAFPFAAPLLDPTQMTIAWDNALQAYVVDYDMQMTMVDSFWHNDTLAIYSEDIRIVGSDTVQIFNGDNIVSLPTAAIDSININNGFHGTFVHESDTSQEWSRQTLSVSFTSLDSSAVISLRGSANTQVYDKTHIWSQDSSYACTEQYDVNVTVLDVALEYGLFIDMENSPGCPNSGSLLITVQMNQACVGDWFCYVDITGSWDVNQTFDAGTVGMTIDYTTGGLSWSLTEQCGGDGPSAPRFGSRLAQR